MIFRPLPLAGAYLIELEPHRDERGFFARSYCREEFAHHGLVTDYPQNNVSFNARAGTLRGMHWQADPHAETKLVRCTAGAIYDVIIDLRPGSATHLQWFGVELDAANRHTLYVPAGFAHGFETRIDETEVAYQMSPPYEPGAGRGARWDDPAFGIEWPATPSVISERDRSYPDFDPTATGVSDGGAGRG